MNGFLNFLLHFVFIATFAFLFVVSFILLKPFRTHRTRPVSTIALKVSYLVYLLVFISLVYLILFYSELPADEIAADDDLFLNLCYSVIIISFFVPNLAIMLRRKVKKLRLQYNLFFTFVNVLISLALIFVARCFPIEI